MEKQQNIANSTNCDSMATTIPVDYQDPPPAYRNAGVANKQPPMVQIAKIVAIAACSIAAMLSFALVFSAWMNSSQHAVCQTYSSPSIETISPQALRGLMGASDLDLAESKVSSNNDNNNSNNKKESAASSEEDRDSSSSGEDITMIKLPVELNLQEHMFERNQRSHMNCIIEKKKAEEIVDEQAKPLPPLLGINMSTDPTYRHFTAEKMAISCDSGNDHRHAPPVPIHMMDGPPPPPHHIHNMHQQMSMPSGSANIPIHIIGPIPLGPQQHPDQFQSMNPMMMNSHHSNLIPIIIPQGSEEGPIFMQPPPQHFNPFAIPQQQMQQQQNNHLHQQSPIAQSSEIRELREKERALHHPVPIFPREHIQHVIRPRSTDAVAEKRRVKRCACDCACKNHDN